MKRPIKFRARNEYGEVFYGSFDEDTCTIDCWDIAETAVVERDTVAQLVGFDKNGREVYEGDLLTDKLDNDREAELYGHARDHDCADITRELDEVFLKEDEQ